MYFRTPSSERHLVYAYSNMQDDWHIIIKSVPVCFSVLWNKCVYVHIPQTQFLYSNVTQLDDAVQKRIAMHWGNRVTPTIIEIASTRPLASNIFTTHASLLPLIFLSFTTEKHKGIHVSQKR